MCERSMGTGTKLKVGIVIRGNHGKSTAEQMAKYFEVVTFELPEELPELIEDVELPDFDVDVLISYASHPDVNLELVRSARAKLIIITGKGGSRAQLREEAEKYGKRVLAVDICCVTPTLNDFPEFFRYFGKPEFEVEIEGGRLRSVKVLRCAFCGATHFVAEMLKGASVEEAPAKAGYLTQVYPCLASRGIDGKIHLAAEMHKIAMEKAIRKAKQRK